MFAAASGAVGAVTAFAQSAAGAPRGRWLTLAPFPEPVPELTAAAVNGDLYVMQGQRPGFVPAGLVYEYDWAANAWTKKKSMPRAVHHGAMVAFHDRIYTFGGFVVPQAGLPGCVAVNDVWEYDPRSDAWCPRAPMPTARGAAGAAVAHGRIYVVGGAGPTPNARDQAMRPADPQRSLATVEEYDPVANRWRVRAPMPVARHHLAVETAGGKIYAIGGRLGDAFVIGMSRNVDLTLEYNPSGDMWLARAAMGTARSGINSTSLGGRIYVAGGEAQTGQRLGACRAFETYDPAANVWHTLPPLLMPRHDAAMAAFGNRIHILGGDVQSAIVPLPAGLNWTTAGHETFEVSGQAL